MYDGMKSMAKTPMESEMAGRSDSEPSYPFNMSLSLQQSDLDKLDADCNDEDCQVGNYVEIRALARIEGKHKSDMGDGEKVTLNLQITHMEICGEDQEDSDYDSSSGAQ